MKKYQIRVNCACFDDIVVEAKNLEEAKELAENQFNCSANAPEASDMWEVLDE